VIDVDQPEGDDRRWPEVELAVARRMAWLRAEGFRIVTHTGGGNCERNLVIDVDTGDVLADLPDTIEAMDAAWRDDWWHEDAVWEDVDPIQRSRPREEP
jgi:hypothetical protein